MTSSTRLKISSYLSTGLFLIMVPVLVWSIGSANAARSNNRLINEICAKAYERVTFRDEFVLFQEARSKAQWLASTKKAELLLQKAARQLTDNTERQVLAEMQESFYGTVVIFSRMLEVTEMSKRADLMESELGKRLYSQLVLRAFTFQGTANRLQKMTEIRLSQANHRTLIIIFVFVAVAAMSTVINTRFLNRAMRALQKSEVRIRAVVEDQTEVICRILADGTITFVNEVYCRIFGKTRAELLGSKWCPHAFPDDVPIIEGKLRLMSTSNPVVVIENRVYSASGDIRWMQFVNRGFFDSEGRLIESQVVGRDITERIQQEEALKKSEYEFRMLAEAMPQIVWITRPDGWNIYFNQRWVDYTGLTLEESYGHGWNKPFHPEDQQIAWDAWQDATTHGATYSLECRLRRADGVYKWWLIRGVPVRGEQGVILKWFGTCTDIDEIKQAEDDLRSYSRRLIEMEESLRKQLAAELHDEIGRDLTAIGMNLAIIGGSMSEASNTQVEIIEDSKRLTEGISRSVRGIMSSLRPPVLDDFGLVAALRWHSEFFSKRFGIETLVQADDSFPRLTIKREEALFRIAQEALMNIAKHADSPCATITLRSIAGMILLAVGDEGKGLVLASSVQLLGDSGWGIKIMRERAELIGGTLHVESSPKNGTVVLVNIPLEEA